MKVTIELSKKARVEGFLDWLKERALDDDHKANRDAIADFVDKFVVFEMKRLANDNETYQEDIEIPDSVLIEPLRRAREQVTKAFDTILGGQGIANPAPQVEPQLDGSGQVASQAAPAPATAPAASSPKSGNGHKSEKKRDLTDTEKDSIRAEFVAQNGTADDDHWVEFKKGMDDEVAIFQVTGFVSYLHREVARGNIILGNQSAYLTWLKGQYKLWAQYQSPKYSSYRAKVAKATQPQYANGMPTR